MLRMRDTTGTSVPATLLCRLAVSVFVLYYFSYIYLEDLCAKSYVG